MLQTYELALPPTAFR